MAPEPEAEASCETEEVNLVAEAATSKLEHPLSHDEGDSRRICPSCGRRFNPTSFERHQRVCQQVFRTTRPQFDPMKGSLGSTSIGSKVGLARVLVPKQDAAPRFAAAYAGASVMPLHSSASIPLGTRSAAATAPREQSPGGVAGGLESIEDQEQRVMHMLQVQMEELRDMRRRCSQAKEDITSPGADSGGGEQDFQSPTAAEITCGTEESGSQEEAVPNVGRGNITGSTAPLATSSPVPGILVGSSAASGSRAPRPYATQDAEGTSNGSTGTRGLKACENCGRSFNPASFEKHRAVCRSVFGKSNRVPFESHTQRLRSLPFSSTPSLNSSEAAPVRTRSPTSGSLREFQFSSAGGSLQCPAAGGSLQCPVYSSPDASEAHKALPQRKTSGRLSTKNSNGTSPSSGHVTTTSNGEGLLGEEPVSPGSGAARLQSPPRPLQPCPHCGRSFRAAAFEKHTKVCQSVFPSHDARTDQRHVYDSRTHRLKGTAFEAYRHASHSPPRTGGERAASATPALQSRAGGAGPQVSFSGVLPASPTSGRGSSRTPKMQLRRSASESHMPGSSSRDPSRDPSAMAEEAGRFYMGEASLLPSEFGSRERPEMTDLALKVGSPQSRLRAASTDEAAQISPRNPDVQAFVEDRRGRLERARFGMKMGQRPEYSSLLSGSSSEQVLREVASGFGVGYLEKGDTFLRGSSWRPSSVGRRRSDQVPISSGRTPPARRSTQPPDASTPQQRTDVRTAGSLRAGPAGASPTRGIKPGSSPGNLEALEARLSDWMSRSHPVLSVAEPEDASPPTAGAPPSTKPLHVESASAERRGRSPFGGASGGDFRSFYDRCLDDLDRIDASELAMSSASKSARSGALHLPMSPNLQADAAEAGDSSPKRVKPGLGREDPAAAPSSRTGAAVPQPVQSSRLPFAARGQLASRSNGHAGGHDSSLRCLTPRRKHAANTQSVGALPSTSAREASLRAPILSQMLDLPRGSSAAGSAASPPGASAASPPGTSPHAGSAVAPVRVRTAPTAHAAAPYESAVSGTAPTTPHGGPQVPHVMQASSANPAAYVTMPRSQYGVPRLDLRQVGQPQERMRSAQAATLPQKAAAYATRQMTR